MLYPLRLKLWYFFLHPILLIYNYFSASFLSLSLSVCLVLPLSLFHNRGTYCLGNIYERFVPARVVSWFLIVSGWWHVISASLSRQFEIVIDFASISGATVHGIHEYSLIQCARWQTDTNHAHNFMQIARKYIRMYCIDLSEHLRCPGRTKSACDCHCHKDFNITNGNKCKWMIANDHIFHVIFVEFSCSVNIKHG